MLRPVFFLEPDLAIIFAGEGLQRIHVREGDHGRRITSHTVVENLDQLDKINALIKSGRG